MRMLLTMRTADRSPKRNYLADTLESLRRGGVDYQDIHVFPTSPSIGWLLKSTTGLHLHPAPVVRTPNENGLAPIELLEEIPADWIVLSEDDLAWCPDPIGKMARWLERYATPDVLVYRFFAFGTLTPISPHTAKAPLREQRGSQVVALRADDARRFARWAHAHRLSWRPPGAPYQDRPHDGFDKLIGYWALQDRPAVPHGLVSRPFLVKHLGVDSSLHRRGIRLDGQFIGAGSAAWP